MPLTPEDSVNIENMREQAAKVKEELLQLKADHFNLEIKSLSNLVSIAQACPPSLDVSSQQLLDQCNSCQSWYEQLKERTAKCEQKLKEEPIDAQSDTPSTMSGDKSDLTEEVAN